MEIHDSQAIRDQVHIVLRGPDGKVKDERTLDSTESNEKREDIAKALADELKKHW